jgi:heme-degrading monooxygenase HmoA
MFARVISAQSEPEGVDSAIRIAQEQLPGAREQPGFSGFYLLADRTSGKLLTISLWQSHEDLRRVESRAAQSRGQAAAEMEVATPGVTIYEVAIQA